jgi:hypothetical protein
MTHRTYIAGGFCLIVPVAPTRELGCCILQSCEVSTMEYCPKRLLDQEREALRLKHDLIRTESPMSPGLHGTFASTTHDIRTRRQARKSRRFCRFWPSIRRRRRPNIKRSAPCLSVSGRAQTATRSPYRCHWRHKAHMRAHGLDQGGDAQSHRASLRNIAINGETAV